MEMQRYTLQEFVEKSKQRDRGQGLFELESPYMLEVNLNGDIWTKAGSMVAYIGNIKFTREGIMEQGLGKMLKKAMTGEGAKLTKASGAGRLYLADDGKKVQILNLQGESIFVNGNDLLAFEPSIQWDIKFQKKISAIAAGGFFNVELRGTGMIAVGVHYEPMTLVSLPTSPSAPIPTQRSPGRVRSRRNLKPMFPSRPFSAAAAANHFKWSSAAKALSSFNPTRRSRCKALRKPEYEWGVEGRGATRWSPCRVFFKLPPIPDFVPIPCSLFPTCRHAHHHSRRA
jgi:uncharacterized protein (AIM24 family)